MRFPTLCLALFLTVGCATASPPPPALGVISTDNAGGWLLFTDQPNVSVRTHIYVLSTDPKPHVTCCAIVIAATAARKGRENFFSNADSDLPTKQSVFRVKVPDGALTRSNPNAIAVWNTSNVTVQDGGYALEQVDSQQRYEVDSCFGAEGINFYLRKSTKGAPPLAHYYVDFGYGIGAGNCPD